jgi:serine/threonine protein kinase
MECVSGGDLFKFLERHDFVLKEERARQITHEITAALYYLHSFGIAHRDIKPENIMLVSKDEDAEIKLVDFGLSGIVGPTETCVEPFGTLVRSWYNS